MNNANVVLHSESSVALCLILFPAESDRFTLFEIAEFEPPISYLPNDPNYQLKTLLLHPNRKSLSVPRPLMGQLNEILIDYFNKFKMGNDGGGRQAGHICIPCLLAVAMLSQAAQAGASSAQTSAAAAAASGWERERERESNIAQMRV